MSLTSVSWRTKHEQAIGDNFSLLVHQELIKAKETGGEKFSSTLEAGERLYPSTSTDGREVIRQQLRDLRERWETYCDNLNDTLRHLDTTLAQVRVLPRTIHEKCVRLCIAQIVDCIAVGDIP